MTAANLPASSESPAVPTDSRIAGVFAVSILLAALAAAYAVVSARDLVYDGSFYLLGIATHRSFQLFEPGRVSVQILQQCLAVLGARLGIHDLWTLGCLFALGASGWPIILTASCWFVVPSTQRIWLAGPLLNLVVAIPATSFIGIGEGVIASCLLWLAFLLVSFRMESAPGAVMAITVTLVCAFSHESAVPCLVLIAFLAISRAHESKILEHTASFCVAAIATAGACYELFWIVFPRSAIERSDFLVSLLGGFLGTPHAPNLPALASLAAVAALPFVLSRDGKLRAATITTYFALLAVTILLLVALPGELIAPSRFFAARGLPVGLTTLLAIAFFLMKRRGLSPAQFANGPTLAILFSLAVFQPLAQAIMTENWNIYVSSIRGLVSVREGAILHSEAMHAIDPDGTRFRRELLESWSVEPLSIVLAHEGHVAAILLPASNARWIPYRNPASLPRAPGLDWSGFGEPVPR
ncbi:MAG TPA: hypothetical protein VGI20_11165 [Rhizomicrobium sp.]|jgi:hypothetical protein